MCFAEDEDDDARWKRCMKYGPGENVNDYKQLEWQ